MMYRSGWAEKNQQERILAIRLSIDGFLEILRASFDSRKDAYGPNGPQPGKLSMIIYIWYKRNSAQKQEHG